MLRLREDVHFKYLRPEDEEVKGHGGEQGKLEALQLALTVLQVPPHMCEGLFKVLAAVLWLGNIQFQVMLSSSFSFFFNMNLGILFNM